MENLSLPDCWFKTVLGLQACSFLCLFFSPASVVTYVYFTYLSPYEDQFLLH